jgi:hypothetical protein
MLAQQRAIAAEAWRIEMVTPRTILESYKVLRVGAKEVAQHRDGLTLLDPTVVWMARLGLFDRSQAPGPDDFATTSQIKDFGEKLDSTPGFLWMVSDGNDRITQVNAGRAFMRVQLAATAQGVVMQPLAAGAAGICGTGRDTCADPPPARRRRAGADGADVGPRRPCAGRAAPAPRPGIDAFIVRT